ncbi:MAG: tyrosine-type recombinase/integrase [Desulfobulbaceae bacterium]|nr:MAG: tyrosine-type recombinase/integrase [Desulfobulbaceae bacterium]
MKKGENTNRPAIGAQIKVDPIRTLKDIQAIKKLLRDKPRDYCLFTLGINTNLRAGDLLSIKYDQVAGLSVGGELILKEKKTGKSRRISLNQSAIEAIQKLTHATHYEEGDYLFKGQRGVLTVPSVNRLVKSWCAEINLQGNYGSHTLRKTFGYHQRTQLNTSIPELMMMFNHSTQRQTLDYLCIQPDEIKDAYLKLCL